MSDAAPRSRWLPRLGRTALVVAALLLPPAARVAWEGRAELEQAELAQRQDRTDLEILHLGRAARWRLPVGGYDDAALDRLMALGERLELAGEAQTNNALTAYREVRSALLATRAWGISDEAMFERANAKIARLMAQQEQAFGIDLSGRGDQEGYHAELLAEIPGPDPLRANFAAIAFVLWIGASVGFIVRGLDAHGKVRAGPALRWGAASLLFLVAWMVLLRFADG